MFISALYQGRRVTLNRPRYAPPGSAKKFLVYVMDPQTERVKIVRFGQRGARIKKNDPERRRSFRARHGCDQAKDITSAKYWSCKMW